MTEMTEHMTCHDCGKPITLCVRLSEHVRLCEECYAETQAAYHAETTQQPYQSLPVYCPSPAELHERIAAVRRAAGLEPRHVGQGGNWINPFDLVFRPRTTTTNITGRRGTEGRTV